MSDAHRPTIAVTQHAIAAGHYLATTAGFEHLVSLRMPEEAARVGEEAVALLTAPRCPEEVTTLIVTFRPASRCA